MILHWVLNPGLAVNEIVLGTRVPRVMYICRDCQEPLGARTYAVCPSCRSAHASMIWSGWNGFGHWLGLVCPDCGKDIPSLRNATAWVALRLTVPLWWFPAKWVGPSWLAFEKDRAERARLKLQPVKKAGAVVQAGGTGLWDCELDR
jgi:hypothetical protein